MPHVFRTSVWTRLILGVLMLGMVIASAAVLFLDKPWGNRIGGVVGLLLGVAVTWVYGFRARLEIDLDSGVARVLSPLGHREVPLEHVAEAVGGQHLGLRLVSGDIVRVLAVNNTNVTLLMRRRGRTEVVADEINHLLGRLQAGGPPEA